MGSVWEFVMIAGLIVHGPLAFAEIGRSISVRFSTKFAERTRFRFGFFPTVFGASCFVAEPCWLVTRVISRVQK